jgi:hypothetical protein
MSEVVTIQEALRRYVPQVQLLAEMGNRAGWMRLADTLVLAADIIDMQGADIVALKGLPGTAGAEPAENAPDCEDDAAPVASICYDGDDEC